MAFVTQIKQKKDGTFTVKYLDVDRAALQKERVQQKIDKLNERLKKAPKITIKGAVWDERRCEVVYPEGQEPKDPAIIWEIEDLFNKNFKK